MSCSCCCYIDEFGNSKYIATLFPNLVGATRCFASIPMNQSFRVVKEAYLGPQPILTHKQTVTRIYKKSLKLVRHWTIDRDLFNEEATKIRHQFNLNMSLPVESGLTKRYIREAQEKLVYYAHPEPYVVPYMPGGSKFMRNAPPPLDLCYPDGIPEGEELPPVPPTAIDGSPNRNRPHIVDFGSKSYI